MADLRERFAELDRLEAPDVWDEVRARGPRPPIALGPSPARRVGIALLAFAVASAGLWVALRTFGGDVPRPVGAPAGSILFTGSPEADGIPQVYVAEPNGEVRRLTDDPTYKGSVAWSRDGTRVAFTAWPGLSARDETVADRVPEPESIWVIEHDGTGLRELCEGCSVTFLVAECADCGNEEPQVCRTCGDQVSWSPDGSLLAVPFETETTSGVNLIDVRTGQPRFVETGGPVEGISWAPDGRSLALGVSDGAGGDGGIHVLNVASADLRRLSSHGPRGLPDREPRWSPDGERIAFVREDVRQGVAYEELFVMDADGSNVRQLTSAGIAGRGFDWSPDSSSLAFLDLGAGGNRSTLAVVPAAGGDVRTVLACDERSVAAPCPSDPAWSADGARLLFVGETGAGGGFGLPFASSLFSVAPDGSRLQRLTEDLAYVCCPTPAPATSDGAEPQPEPTEERSPGAEARRYEHPLGWTAEVPAGWHVLELSGFTGRQTVSGAAFSNEPLEAVPDGTAPDLSDLFPDGAVLMVTRVMGGPAPDVISDDSTFPLRWEDFEAIPGGLVIGTTESFRANGLKLTASVGVHGQAPAELIEQLRALIGSIRPVRIEAGQRLPSGHVVVDVAGTEAVGSGAVAYVPGGPFLVVHATGGFYAFGLPRDASGSFAWDAGAREVVWRQDGAVYARYDRGGVPVLSPPAVRLVPLGLHPVARAWDGMHLLVHPTTTYGSLPARMWR